MARLVFLALLVFSLAGPAAARDRSREKAVRAPVPVTLADLVRGKGRHRGLRVRIDELLTVSQAHVPGRPGQTILSAGGRLEEPANRHPAGSPEARRMADGNARRCIVLDGGAQSYRDGKFAWRAGDTVRGITGVVGPGPVTWNGRSICATRIRPDAMHGFARANPRPPVPAVGGTLRIAAFNVRNYFTTIGRKAACLPGRTRKNCRGETSGADPVRQGARIVNVLRALDADVVALAEVENNGETTVRKLVDDLNAALGARIYASVGMPAGGAGGDATRVAMIYRTRRLSAVGRAVSDRRPVHARPPLMQTFATAEGRKFRVAAVHFKSKAGCPKAADRRRKNDADRGQGCWNERRTRQAGALVELLKRDGIPTLLVGDLNAYGKEDPVLEFTKNGFVDEPARFNGFSGFAYSYVFDGRSGALDHALASSGLARYVTGAAHWHINADEPPSAGRGGSGVYRSSDHDPVLVGLDFRKR
jgi:predicted extracellular nuclease